MAASRIQARELALSWRECQKAAADARSSHHRILAERKFQSSPGPKAECYALVADNRKPGIAVSILTRPEGRVLRSSPIRSTSHCWFQSSPGPKAECYLTMGRAS